MVQEFSKQELPYTQACEAKRHIEAMPRVPTSHRQTCIGAWLPAGGLGRWHQVVGAGARPTSACSRPPIRREFQGYFRVVIVFRGANAVCRILGGG